MSTPNPLDKAKTSNFGKTSIFNFNINSPQSNIENNTDIQSTHAEIRNNSAEVKQTKEFIAVPSLRKARESSHLEDIYIQFKNALEKSEFERAEIENLLETLKDSFKKIHARYPTIEQVKFHFFPALNKMLPEEWQSEEEGAKLIEEESAKAEEMAKKAQEILSKINTIFGVADYENYLLNKAKEKYILEIIGNLEANHPIREKLLAIETIAFPTPALTYKKTKETLIRELEKEQEGAKTEEAAKEVQEILNKIDTIFKEPNYRYFNLEKAQEKYALEISNLEANHPIQEKLLAIEAIAFPTPALTFKHAKETLTSELEEIAREHFVLKAKKIFDGLIAIAKAAEPAIEITLITPQNSMMIQYQSSSTKLTTPKNIEPLQNSKVTSQPT